MSNDEPEPQEEASSSDALPEHATGSEETSLNHAEEAAPLRDRDLEELRRSGLVDETIRAAGVFGVTEAEARRLLHRKDVFGGGYAIPYCDLSGKPVLQQDRRPYVNLKLDAPPLDENGIPRKYLKPKGEPNHVYFPPGIATAVQDRTSPLLVTEGEKKALKATQDGFPCLALSGVWGFKTRKGQKPGLSVPVPELDAIPMSGRDLLIVFDSDLATNPHVRQAEQAFARYARNRGATVYLLRLPSGPDGSKVGLDDFLVQHGRPALQELIAQAKAGEQDIENAVEDSPSSETPYRETPSGIFRLKRERDGGLGWIPITNFTARVVEEIKRDDGSETPTHVYRIEGICQGQPLPPVDVLATRFSGMAWVHEVWGLAPAVLPPSTSKEYARHAIQVLSGSSVRTRHIFMHTGWRSLQGRWGYLHAGGAIGADGVDVDLPGELGRYALPAVPEDPRPAVVRSLALLDVAPRPVTVPLLAAVYLAPLIAVLSPKPGFCPFLHGESGTFKTSLACLTLSHFGDFAAAEALSNFSDTANALERRAFVLKDTLMLVDDFHPSAVPHEANARELILQRLVRAAGNRTGRARLTSDASEKRRYEPRGLILITGEELPSVQSTLARLLILDLDRGAVDVKKLTELQTHALELRQAMAAYLAWLAPQLEAIKAEFPSLLRAIRAPALSDGQHPRLTEAVSVLFYGFDRFLEFAMAVGALEESAARELAEMAWHELIRLAKQQEERIRDEDPARRFIEILHALLDTGQVWIKQVGTASSTLCIGVEMGDAVCLFPTETWHAVREYCRNESILFPLKARALYKMLASRGWLQGEGRTHEARATIEGKRRRILKIPAWLLVGTREDEAVLTWDVSLSPRTGPSCPIGPRSSFSDI